MDRVGEPSGSLDEALFGGGDWLLDLSERCHDLGRVFLSETAGVENE